MSVEASHVGCSSCCITSCREEGQLLYVPVPLSVINEAIDRSNGEKFSVIVNISLENEPKSPERSPVSITDVGTLDERKDSLNRKLSARRTPGELRDMGILLSSPCFQAGSILQKSHDLERARVGNRLSQKLKLRPEKDILVSQNILRGSNLEPFVTQTHNKLKRKRIEEQIDHFIANRPLPESIPHNIMHSPASATNSPVGMEQQSSVSECRVQSQPQRQIIISDVPSPPPLPVTINTDNKIRRAVTSTTSIIKSGGFIFHEASPEVRTNDEIRNKQQAVLDKIQNASPSLDAEVSQIYQGMTVPDLKALCRQRGFTVRQKATKSELIKMLMNLEEPKKSARTSPVTENHMIKKTVSKPMPKITKEEISKIMNRVPSSSSLSGLAQLSLGSPSPISNPASVQSAQIPMVSPPSIASVHEPWSLPNIDLVGRLHSEGSISANDLDMMSDQQNPHSQYNIDTSEMHDIASYTNGIQLDSVTHFVPNTDNSTTCSSLFGNEDLLDSNQEFMVFNEDGKTFLDNYSPNAFEELLNLSPLNSVEPCNF